MEVVDRTGDKVGGVKQSVLAPDRVSAHAVGSVGGVLGMGKRDIMILLDDLTPIGDQLQMSATKAEATAGETEAPDAEQYVEVRGDTPISGSIVEFSAFEQGKDANKPTHPAITPNTDVGKSASVSTTPRAPLGTAARLVQSPKGRAYTSASMMDRIRDGHHASLIF